jgi:hypothetical protein
LTIPNQSGDERFILSYLQTELNRRFGDLEKSLDQRFKTVEEDIKDVKDEVRKVKDQPQANFKAYILPILISAVSAILIAVLTRQGLVVKN